MAGGRKPLGSFLLAVKLARETPSQIEMKRKYRLKCDMIDWLTRIKVFRIKYSVIFYMLIDHVKRS